MALREHRLLAALREPGFRRFFAVRLAGQFGDGVFQASLAGAVLFDPERAGHASDVAYAFAVLLLPYSVIGPFAGVLLDRWWRRDVLTRANVVRAVLVAGVALELVQGVDGVAFYASALVVISVNRFVLSALSAALPRVVADEVLVSANAMTSTVGTIAAALGGGAALGLRALVGADDVGYGVIAAVTVVPYLLAALLAAVFPRPVLGPSEDERAHRETPREVMRGLVTGARVIAATGSVRRGLSMLTAHRLLYGIWTVSTVLLYRNYLISDGVFRAGLAGLSQIVAGIAVGGGIASFVTPAAFRRFGQRTWSALLLAASGIVEVAFVLPFTKPTLLVSSLLLAVTSQGIKISVDTLIQHEIDDDYRGRAFAVYDMLFNVAAVLAAVLVALALPEDGHSRTAVLVMGAAWLLTAALYAGRRSSRSTSGRSPRVVVAK